jgi:hypothetical protein
MKFKLLCILLFFSIILGCTKSQIKDSLKANSRANQYTTVTILPINLTDKEFAECVQKKLKQDLQYLKFLQGDKFREAMFPWFEPNTAPKNIKELSSLLSKTLVKKRIDSLGVELLIYVSGYTKEDVSFAEIPYLFLGGIGKRETRILVTVWDLNEIGRVGDTDISSKGSVVGGIGIIPPFIYIWPAFTEGKTCSEAAKRISNCLKRKDLNTDR